MLLEFKRKSDALQIIKMLDAIDPSMETRCIAEIFGIPDKDLNKIFLKKSCFDDMTPAERLATQSECILGKGDNTWAVELNYDLPGDGGDHEESLQRVLEAICIKLKLKVKKQKTRRRKSDYLRQCEKMALAPENFRQRARMMPAACQADNYNLEYADILIEQFERETEDLTINDDNRRYIKIVAEELQYFYRDKSPEKLQKYTELRVKAKNHKGDETSQLPPKQFQRFMLAYRGKSPIDMKSIFNVMISQFGYLLSDFMSFEVSDQADGHESIRSDTHLASVIRHYSSSDESIITNCASSPVFYYAFTNEIIKVIKACRPDVSWYFKHDYLEINRDGLHLKLWTANMSECPDFSNRILATAPVQFLTEALKQGAELTPSIVLLESK